MMNKKGAELPLNVIIIAILAIVALVLLMVLLLGGWGSISEIISNIFHGSIKGTDRVVAETTCTTRCDQANLLSDPTKSAYCTGSFYIDTDNDGIAQKDEKGYTPFYCFPGATNSLGISCNDKRTNTQIACPTK